VVVVTETIHVTNMTWNYAHTVDQRHLLSFNMVLTSWGNQWEKLSKDP
jgi:hypothetical protein